ncbi:MAG TPA: DUF1553 domain-containing protein [Chthoniobacteraceae bacterium]|nr:DUF1553 domain-containing protein [Chthoniobacteraceae bacterium]
MRFPYLLSAACAVTISLPVRAAETAPDFAHEIRPILSNQCFKCHGPDANERKGGKDGSGGLRLDTEEGSRAGLGDGLAAIVPGKLEESELITRILSTDREEMMPPPKSGKKLKPEEIELLKRWVRNGGKYTKHWAYAPLSATEPPPGNGAPLDRFIRARLTTENLTQQPEADRYTLVRRVTLDLTGLAPSLEEVEAFVKDTAPDAYERLVDRLLGSPAFGEHWARMWLDLARYADSAGYADDPARTIWAFRDYVIRSLNANKPFDQFTIEQIAGDLLPNPTEDQLSATAFHRNTMTNSEGGTIDEEWRNAAVVDRVNTTMAVWMGTSMACAQCHTHKYDPITQNEYFQVFAFFNQSEDADRKDETPVLKFFNDEQRAQRTSWEGEIAALDQKRAASTPALAAKAAAWAAAFPADIGWQSLRPAGFKALSGAPMQVEEDSAVKVGGDAKTDTYTLEVSLAGTKFTALRLEALPGNGPGRKPEGNFVVTRVRATLQPVEPTKGPRARFVRIELPGKGKPLQLAEVQVFSRGENVARQGAATQSSTYADAAAQRAIDGNTTPEYEKKSVAHTESTDDPWWEVDLKSEKALERIAVWNRAELGERLQGFKVVALNEQRQVVWQKAGNDAPKTSASFALDGGREIVFSDAVADFTQTDFDESLVLSDGPAKPSKRAKKKGPQKGWAIGGGTGQPHTLTLLPAQPVDVPAGAKLLVTIEQQSPFEKLTLGHFRLATTAEPRVAEVLEMPAEVRAALKTEPLPKPVIDYYVREIAPELEGDRKRLAKLRKQLDDMTPVTVPIMKDLAANQLRKTHVQIRGNYLSVAEETTAGVPAAFHSLPADAPRNRLTLARWLVDEHNPLTPRVVANRFWEAIFGTGLVRTSEEFGAQGELPSHPELLDWLGGELIRSKWDVKHFLKLLVTSASYRQSSRVTPELAERDPENRLLARGPRFRLSAEMVRDQALFVSGLLSRKMYGPSVRPPRPSLGLAAAFGSGLDWQTSAGDDQHRRGIYTEWRRTSPYPSMTTFDAPNREVCTIRRTRTNTPLQALVTLNDPVYLEAAQALARRLATAGATPSDKLRFGFRLCLARPPTDIEVQRLIQLHEEALVFYRQDQAKAVDLATKPIGPAPAGAEVADLAAWTSVANVLLNLDEMLMKR